MSPWDFGGRGRPVRFLGTTQDEDEIDEILIDGDLSLHLVTPPYAADDDRFTAGQQYIGVENGQWHAGAMTKQWYGWSWHVGSHSMQIGPHSGSDNLVLYELPLGLGDPPT